MLAGAPDKKLGDFVGAKFYCSHALADGSYTVSQKKGNHPTTNDNFNYSCPIPVIFGTNIAE